MLAGNRNASYKLFYNFSKYFAIRAAAVYIVPELILLVLTASKLIAEVVSVLFLAVKCSVIYHIARTFEKLMHNNAHLTARSCFTTIPSS